MYCECEKLKKKPKNTKKIVQRKLRIAGEEKTKIESLIKADTTNLTEMAVTNVQGLLEKMIDSKNTYDFLTYEELDKYLTIKSSQSRFTVNYFNVSQGSSALLSLLSESGRRWLLNDLGPNRWNILSALYKKKSFNDIFMKNVWESQKIPDGFFDSPEKDQQLETYFDLQRLWSELCEKLPMLITHGHADHNAGGSLRPAGEYFAGIGDTGVHIERTGMPELKKAEGGSGPTEDLNTTSAVTYKEYGNTIFIFPGDRPAQDLIRMFSSIIDTFKNKNIVIAASHHGSRTGTTREFVQLFSKANSILFVVSSGEGNIFRHPHKEFKDAMPSRESWYDTQSLGMRQGSIIVKSDQNITAVFKKFRDGSIKPGSEGLHHPVAFMGGQKVGIEMLQHGLYNLSGYNDLENVIKMMFHFAAPHKRLTDTDRTTQIYGLGSDDAKYLPSIRSADPGYLPGSARMPVEILDSRKVYEIILIEIKKYYVFIYQKLDKLQAEIPEDQIQSELDKLATEHVDFILKSLTATGILVYHPLPSQRHKYTVGGL